MEGVLRSPQGVKVLGTPIGSFEFIKEVSDRRLEEEQRLWDAIPWIPDLQCHDMGITHDGLGVGRTPWERGASHGGEDIGDVARENGLVGFPICRKDGALCILGVLDVLPMIADRLPQVVAHVVGAVTNVEVRSSPAGPGWVHVQTRLGRSKRRSPTSSLASGNTGGAMCLPLPKEHGVVACVPSRSGSLAVTLRNQGPAASSWGDPTNFEFRLIPEHFRTLLLERLRLPLSVVEARCECGMLLDCLGRHSHSGRLRRRAVAPEKTLASEGNVLPSTDHVLRSAMIAKLLEVAGLRPLLPCVRSICSQFIPTVTFFVLIDLEVRVGCVCCGNSLAATRALIPSFCPSSGHTQLSSELPIVDHPLCSLVSRHSSTDHRLRILCSPP